MEESVKKTEAAIEAILFSMGDAVELKDLADVLQIDGKTVQKILDDMMMRYEEENRGIKIVKLENAYQLCTKMNIMTFYPAWSISRRSTV